MKGLKAQFRLRAQRQTKLMRALRKSLELTPRINRTANIRQGDILAFTTLRNELVRLPYFLDYYRAQGVEHFLMVDNASDDGTTEYLERQKDVSLWVTGASYKASSFGVDWLNHLQWRYGAGHWTLVVDVDEFLVYPFCDTRPLHALTDWLESQARRSFSAMLLDMYPKGPVTAQPYSSGQNPFEIARWFDACNYSIKRNAKFQNLWIQGGVRARAFQRDTPEQSPALNKTPLVHWSRKYAYVSSTHMLLPRGLNKVYDESGGEQASGVLMHAKFLDTIVAKAREELVRREHYAGSREYMAYDRGLQEQGDLWCDFSTEYINWRQLEILGLMSKGDWA
ncbi:glycosyltransferase family 2 protein [Roseinatronobacter alkalisoli]|uniref:Glycosyltransferase family 2 protein n=1 Tax=Roseinatronobacter alkalisoli TaxID=3028235 RepID=A0ABT5T5S9_9RHOB|nr:glycosyltransferase family 2 protein [Roseinatronobacter sp. HJB301]MDD7970467.1 glycosyltransferase family 2 protein [Roseinatronobacter sp. HJB301]